MWGPHVATGFLDVEEEAGEQRGTSDCGRRAESCEVRP